MTTFILYRDRKREWRWHAKRKGRIVAESGEGYERIAKARSAIDQLGTFKVVVKEGMKISAYDQYCEDGPQP